MSERDPVSLDAFARRWRALGATGPERAHADLVRRYRAPGRHYHDLEHVAECLRWAAHARAEIEDVDAVEIALWFHDAVHGSGGDDVGASAELFATTAAAAGMAGSAIAEIRALIEVTRHDGQVVQGDAAVVADLDLAILGSDPARFARYEADVRREHADVDEATYRRARAALLRSFLERLAIYRTARFAERLEAQARVNLGRSLRRLEEA